MAAGKIGAALAAAVIAWSLFYARPASADDSPADDIFEIDDGYFDYEEMMEAAAIAEQEHHSIAKIFGVGESVQGREIIAVKISDNVGVNENEAEILFDGAIHGDEQTGAEVAMCLIDFLLDNYSENDTVTNLVDEREIWVVPMVNPDGVEAGARENANGVDCNRDFGYMWDGSEGSESPFSQPETAAMFHLADDRKLAMATSFHSGNEVLVYPWSYTYEPTVDADNFEAIGAGYGKFSGYPYMQSGTEDYTVVGSSKDFYYGSLGTLAWSIEVSNEKKPPASEIASYCDRNEEAMLFLIWASGQGLAGTVTDAQTGIPVPALIKITSLGWVFYADPEVGDFHRFLIPGTYDVEISANGYAAKIFNDVEVVSGEHTDISTGLTRDEALPHFGYQLLYNSFREEEGATSVTVDALGPPDGAWYSIGRGGFAVIDMGPSGQSTVEPPNKVTVFGNDTVEEGFELLASTNPFGPWTSLGECKGTCSFALEGEETENARYFQIVDDGVAEPDEALVDPGYDLDAISVSFGAADADSDADSDSDTDSVPDAGGDDIADGSDDASCGCGVVGSGFSFHSLFLVFGNAG